jgi:hypothetical protein
MLEQFGLKTNFGFNCVTEQHICCKNAASELWGYKNSCSGPSPSAGSWTQNVCGRNFQKRCCTGNLFLDPDQTLQRNQAYFRIWSPDPSTASIHYNLDLNKHCKSRMFRVCWVTVGYFLPALLWPKERILSTEWWILTRWGNLDQVSESWPGEGFLTRWGNLGQVSESSPGEWMSEYWPGEGILTRWGRLDQVRESWSGEGILIRWGNPDHVRESWPGEIVLNKSWNVWLILTR